MTYPCDLCSEVFNRKDNLLRHKVRLHGYKSDETCEFTCEQCSRKFARKDNFERHLKSSTNPDGTLKYKCSKCDETFCTAKLIQDHCKAVHARLSCEDCGEKFTQAQALDTHRLNKTAVTCDECEKVLCNQVSLNRHKNKIHNRVKCEECGFVYIKMYIQYHKLWDHPPKKS